MSEPLLSRVRRLISAGIEDAVDAMERARGPGVMREAIREVDRLIDEVRAAQDAAMTARLVAMRQQRLFRGSAATLEEKARFALAERREDLAEAAITRQIEFEAQASRLDPVQAAAAEEADRLGVCLTALTARKDDMNQALAAFEAARRDVLPDGDMPVRPGLRTDRRLTRAEEAFDRAMAGAGGACGLARADAQVASKVAELTMLQTGAAVAQRLAALRSSTGAD